MEIVFDTQKITEAGFDTYLIRVIAPEGVPVSFADNRLTDASNLVGGTIGGEGVIYLGSKQIRLDGRRGTMVWNDGTQDVVTLGKLPSGSFGIDIAEGQISGDSIVANSITSDQIAAGTITADNIEAGTITATEIADATITNAKLVDATIEAAKIKDSTITGAKIVDSTITSGKISVDNLAAISASLGNVTAGVLTVNGGSSSYITIARGTSSGSNANLRFSGGGKIWEDSSNHMGIMAENDLYIYRDGTTLVAYFTGTEAHIYDDLLIGSGSGGEDVMPTVDGAGSVGTDSYTWADVWAVDTSINSSDRRAKTSIETSDLGLDFIQKLSPIKYKWKEVFNKEHKKDPSKPLRRPGKRYHYGLVAQDVEKVISGDDFAGLVISENGKYALRYGEFIGPLIKAVQELSERVGSLEKELEEYKNN